MNKRLSLCVVLHLLQCMIEFLNTNAMVNIQQCYWFCLTNTYNWLLVKSLTRDRDAIFNVKALMTTSGFAVYVQEHRLYKYLLWQQQCSRDSKILSCQTWKVFFLVTTYIVQKGNWLIYLTSKFLKKEGQFLHQRKQFSVIMSQLREGGGACVEKGFVLTAWVLLRINCIRKR